MTAPTIVNLQGMTNPRYPVVQVRRSAARQLDNMVRVVEPTADDWRVVELRKAMNVFFHSVAALIAHAEDGEPTWEDAEWQ